jgi:uncharacterized Ntn-hydrolase superfamily protein
MDEKVWEEKYKTHDDKLDDHESRIRILERNDMKREVQFAEIQKSQAELKSLVMESTKEQNKTISKFMEELLGTFKNNNNTENEIKVNSNKQKWIIIGSIITAITSILVAIFK